MYLALTQGELVQIQQEQPIGINECTLYYGGVAQMEEQVTENHRVEDSSASSAASGNSASGSKYASMHGAETIRRTDAVRTRDS